ncbi:HAD family phosphatase [Desulfuromonas sp. AOP6]|uniref:HAD family hydrolase n=1 Tax=Desulfuromonas sp. AOP6 TaxID=1566351 RepID=UPI001282BC6C|nr:HAD family phosphatase [Desulfuromonas sp. AOP6]BCA79711.1 haloacid dehalogenase [Desulfuromonas sp. AOP6]
MLKAVIFDFDGVIVDTEPLHHRAFMEVLSPFGISCTWQEYREHYMGFDDRDGFRAFFKGVGKTLAEADLHHLIDQKAAAFQRIASKGVTPYPGVLELVETLATTLPVALCSGALRSDIDPILDGLGIAHHFSAMVTADDVRHSKPDPESYLLAVARLRKRASLGDSSPGVILAIEDTPAGIDSARGAGLSVLAVSNSYPKSFLESLGVSVVSSLKNVTFRDLNQFAGY